MRMSSAKRDLFASAPDMFTALERMRDGQWEDVVQYERVLWSISKSTCEIDGVASC